MSHYSSVEWNKYYMCHHCKGAETLLEDTEDNRKHWAWGSYKTKSQREYNQHNESQDHIDHFKDYLCEGCDKQYFNKHDYEAHCKTALHKKNNKIVIKCNMCEYETYNPFLMEQHNQTQKHIDRMNGVEKETYCCELCNFKTLHKSRLEQHNKTQKHIDKVNGVEKQTVFRCELCDYETSFKHCLEQHNKTQKHQDKVNGIEKPCCYHCEKCNYSTSIKGLFEQHNNSKKHNQ